MKRRHVSHTITWYMSKLHYLLPAIYDAFRDHSALLMRVKSSDGRPNVTKIDLSC